MGAPLFANGTLAITSTCYFNTNFFLTLGLCSVRCCLDSLVSECFCLVFVLFCFFPLLKYLGDLKPNENSLFEVKNEKNNLR